MALASASTPAIAIITAKYWSISPIRSAEKPWSIMRRTASGTTSVAAAATSSATSAAATCPR